MDGGRWAVAAVTILGLVSLASPALGADIPRVAGITVDGEAGDWGERGFLICMLMPMNEALRPASDLDANCRLGWDDRGLLVLLNVHDDAWMEAETGLPFWGSDSASLSMAPKDAGSVEIEVSPAMDVSHPEVRFNAIDNRTVKQPAISYQIKRVKTATGYTLEGLLPWSNFGMRPQVGQELGFRVVVNDVDPTHRRYAPRWFPAGGTAKGTGLRLAEQASEAANRMIAGGDYPRFHRARVRVDAVADLAGKTVLLKLDGRTLGQTTLEAAGLRASATAVLPMPKTGESYSGLSASIEGGPVTEVALPNLGEERARAMIGAEVSFRPYVFSGTTFPAGDFEQPGMVEDLIGPYTVKVTYYDAEYNVVSKAEKAGRYGAVVEVTPENGKAFRRFRTLYRTTGRFAPVGGGGRSRERSPGDGARDKAIPLPGAIGIEPEVAELEATVLEGLLSQGLREGLGRNPRAAQILAGLYDADPADGAAEFYDDWQAQDRQWWVGLKRKMDGLDKEFATPIERPVAIDGSGAPVLRGGTAAEAGMKADAVEKIDAICRQWAENSDQGFAVCLARHGVVFFHRAYGERMGRAMSTEDKSNVASITKTMGGLMIMMLVDQGLLDLDSPVSKYVPAMRGVATKKPVTLRLLARHRSGMPASIFAGDEVADLEESLALYFPFLDVDGRFEYATATYGLLGKVLENISGESLPRFYQKHLVGPLGLGCEAGAMGYGVRSTAMDMAVLGQVLVNHGAYGKWRFMSEETFQKMLPPNEARLPEGDMGEMPGIGMRWYRIDPLGDRFLGHNSGTESILRADLDSGLVIVMTRGSPGKNFSKYEPMFMETVAQSVAR